MSDNILFKKDNFHIIPNSNTKYLCNVALQIQSVYHSTKDKDKHVVYYSQVQLKECGYELFLDTRKIDPRLKRKNKLNSRLKRKNKPEPEPEYNEDIVLE